jgi:hypothetical protein
VVALISSSFAASAQCQLELQCLHARISEAPPTIHGAWKFIALNQRGLDFVMAEFPRIATIRPEPAYLDALALEISRSVPRRRTIRIS